MISGISAATNGLRSAYARFDRAATAVSQGADADDEISVSGGLADAMVSMLTAKIGVRASLEAVRTANDMLAEAIDLGGYAPRD